MSNSRIFIDARDSIETMINTIEDQESEIVDLKKQLEKLEEERYAIQLKLYDYEA